VTTKMRVAGTVIAESSQSDASAAAELGLAEVTTVEGVEDLAPLSGSAVAGHPEPSPESRTSVDGPGRTLTVNQGSVPECTRQDRVGFPILPCWIGGNGSAAATGDWVTIQ